MDVKKHLGARRLAGAALLAAGIAAGAACGTPVQFRTAAPPAPAAPAAPSAEVVQKINLEAGSAWAARVAIADRYSEIRTAEAKRALPPSAEVVQKVNLEAGSAWAARVAIADRYSEIRTAEAKRALVARQAGWDRHLELLAGN